eukprot:TRINITY_DN3419_c0_g1_i1.p1 TRINITY_DN3419_c0_g1~~TRINITY_DN3419_c0_g1_i1.p1  ORF type:complete len:109 (+),score=26.03 TRINITY_DN3419_c0_g1_i1:53-379(+)
MSQRVTVLSSYRNLLRTQQRVFRNDHKTLRAAKIKTREEYLKNAAENDQKKLETLISQAKQTSVFLSTHVFQGHKQNNEDKFVVKMEFSPQNVMEQFKKTTEKKQVEK